jgi:hypothetical protein
MSLNGGVLTAPYPGELKPCAITSRWRGFHIPQDTRFPSGLCPVLNEHLGARDALVEIAAKLWTELHSTGEV